ncbi:MAG: GNAT family protein [Planctomycetota bacterium]
MTGATRADAGAFEWGDRLPTLAGATHELRWMEDRHAQDVFALFAHSEVVRYWSSPAMTDPVQGADHVRSVHELFAQRHLFEWGVFESGSDVLVGTATVFKLDGSHRRAEVGYALRRDLWGRGIGTEVVGIELRFCFETLGLHRVEADVDPENAGSLRVLERHGFRREGLLRERWIQGGVWCDSIVLGLLRDEWTRPSERARSDLRSS